MAIAQQAQPFNRTPSKPKKDRFNHVSNTKYGMGDNYGSGIRNKLATIRDDSYTIGYKKVDKKGLKTPPKSLA